ncbi:MAG: LysR family transcriptional regulator [Clostridiales bacterium]|nr:LysR family transcriptional regulator [Clostridiales bacterium]
MELRTLNYFLTVAREENITRAAALLHLTQPTLSRQLMQLEEELGVKLFRRSQHRIILTDAGLLLRRRAQEIVELAERAAQELHPQAEISGSIAIGSGDLRSMTLLADLLADFRRAHPQIRYTLFSGNSDDIKERIEHGLLDLGLLLEPVDFSKYEILRLPVKERWGVLAPAGTPLAAKESVTPQDLAGMPVIMTTRELMQREMIRWLGPCADQIQVQASGNLPYNLAQLARKQVGVFLNIEQDCAYTGLQFVPLSPPLQSGTVLAWKKAAPASAAITALLLFAQEYINRITAHPE